MMHVPVRQLLEAIDAAEVDAHEAPVALRICAADRKLVEEYVKVNQVVENAAEFDLSNPLVLGLRNGPERAVMYACERYGLEVAPVTNPQE